MLIEIHMIQNHSPANLNRDDLGAPKTCIFGGVTRARISSQCLKRSIRNPGNPDDVHNQAKSTFAEVMGDHIGVRTKLFPWLVKQELKQTDIPEDERKRIVMKAQDIATAKEKEQKKSKDEAADNRPKTPQLISFGRGDAKRFVAKLAELRKPEDGAEGTSKRYAYFLNPQVGFEEMVRGRLDDLGVNKKDIDRIVRASWVIATCRMSQLPTNDTDHEGDEEGTTQDASGDSQHQPGDGEAKRIADDLAMLSSSDAKEDKEKFKALTKAATSQEKKQINEDAPTKPKKMDSFTSDLKEALRCNAVDVALFGRMTTSDYFDDMEAAMQVAHAISTHAAVNEVDYFTAVDDLGKAGGGAGHVDEAMFNAPCFYKYFCLDWDQLVRNLAGPEPDKEKDADTQKKWNDEIESQAKRLAACTLGHFIRAAAMTTPSGKQNSFASHTEPCSILVEIKKNGKHPTNYANAFADPVERAGNWDDDGPDYVSLEGRSIVRFGDHIFNFRKAYGVDSTLLWYAVPLYRFPLQGWERETDGHKAKIRNEKDEPTDKDKPPVQFADRCFDTLGANGDGKPGLIETVIEEIGMKWTDVKDVGKAQPAGAIS